MPLSSHRSAPTARPWITRTGNMLYENGVEWRFSGTNIYWLALAPVSSWTVTSDLRYPDPYEVDDAYAQCHAYGINLVRVWSMMPSLGCPRAFFGVDGASPNADTYAAMDYAVARAADFGLRLMIPLCDPWGYYVGTPATWSTALGGNGSDFFTNSTVIDGWKAILTAHLQHVNTRTGMRYCDDPTICIWETGNEINAPDAWISEICEHLKSLAPNALTKDGGDLIAIRANSLSDPNVDCVGAHYYPMSSGGLTDALATENLSDKVFFTLEYDWNSQRGQADGYLVSTFGPALIANRTAYPGQGWWNLAAHAADHGWQSCANQYTGQGPYLYDAMLGNASNESKTEYLRTLGYQVCTGSAPPAWPVPGIPLLAGDGSALAWRGCAGASSYTVERSTDGVSFAAIATDLIDAETPWTDPDPPGGTPSYRVRAVNPDGVAGLPSNAVNG